MAIDKSDIIAHVLGAVRSGDAALARDVLRTDYPFVPVNPEARRSGKLQMMKVFVRDGFIDRYSGQRLVFPAALRLLSRHLPQEFPYHPNWKTSVSHQAFWELLPTIDHRQPIARGGADSEENLVTTSQIRNSAKANWTLEELGWKEFQAGALTDWDGLTRVFLEMVESDRSVLDSDYMKGWHAAAVKCGAFTLFSGQ